MEDARIDQLATPGTLVLTLLYFISLLSCHAYCISCYIEDNVRFWLGGEMRFLI